MALDDRIFPTGPPRDGHIRRLDLVQTWESQLLGVGRTTAFLTPRLLSQNHAVDDIGLYVVFLQRHRVELGLKLVLERASAAIPTSHVISELFDEAQRACAAVGMQGPWDHFAAAQCEFVELIDATDPAGATFRYPVDRLMRPWPRETRVDLVELEHAGRSFEHDVQALIAELAALEDLPVDAADAPAAAAALHAFVVAAENLRAIHADLKRQYQAQTDALMGPIAAKIRRSDQRSAAQAVADVTDALVVRVERMLSRILTAHAITLDDPAPPEPVRTIPPPRLGPDQAAMAASFDAQLKWYSDEFTRGSRPLVLATNILFDVTKNWEGHAARQVHLDVARFRARLASPALVNAP